MPKDELTELERIEMEKRRGAPVPVLTQEETDQRAKHISNMMKDEITRNGSRPEFDGMDYVTRYTTNQQADMSYIPPKLNKNDVRVVTGTTREKDNSLLAALLNYNFEDSITAFDENNNEIYHLGTTLTDLVRKSREQEDYDSKRDLIYRELIIQGDVFVMEGLVAKFRVKKTTNFDWETGVDIGKFKMEQKTELEYRRPEATMLSGTKVFLGNIREPMIQNQPRIEIVETEPYEIVRNQFEKWDMWKYVPRKIARLQPNTDVSLYRDWTMLTTKDDYVEKIWYLDRPSNTAQLYLNGVPMLPVGFPLEAISPSGLYPVAQGSCEKTPFFAYAKGIAEKMKVDQAIIDEFMKLAILKQQQAYKPPLANNTGSELSPDIYSAGAVIDNLDPDKIKAIFPTDGMSQSDVMFFQYMKEIMDSKSVSAYMTGEKTPKMTAAQYMDQKKQSLQKLGLIVWGVVQFEKHLNWLRLQTILKHGLGNGIDDKTVIRVKTTLGNGKNGQRVIDFSGTKKFEGLSDDEMSTQIGVENKLLSDRYGMETVKDYLDIDGIRTANLTFRHNITPTEKDTSDLQKMMLSNEIRDAVELFGPQSLNTSYFMELWATRHNYDFSRAFVQQNVGMEGQGLTNGQPQQVNVPGGTNLAAVGPKKVIEGQAPQLRIQ